LTLYKVDKYFETHPLAVKTKTIAWAEAQNNEWCHKNGNDSYKHRHDSSHLNGGSIVHLHSEKKSGYAKPNMTWLLFNHSESGPLRLCEMA